MQFQNLLLIVCLGSPLPAVAEVYRWTDEQGRVHYGERPPAEGASVVDLDHSDPDGAVDAELAKRQARQRRMLDAYAHEHEKKERAATREAERKSADAARCRKLQAYWQRLNHGGPIYFKRDDGGRDYLDEKQREAEKARVRPAYLEACGSPP